MSKVRVIPLGGVGEIGKNCTVVEQGDDIVVIDCGLSFPNEEMYGVDIVVPDFTYLLENKEKVRGIFITHAHEDHVGGLPYLLRQLNVPIYCTEFTQALIRARIEERVPEYKPVFKVYSPGQIIQAGSLSVEPVRITHSIPENCGIAVRTNHGIVFFTGDFKFDFTPVDAKLSDMTRLGEMGNEGVVLLLSDSTNVERPGWGPSESSVSVGLKKAMDNAEGRILLTTFASNIHRMQQFYDMAAEAGRKVAVVGRRMEQNIETCARMGYIKIPNGIRISLQDMRMYADNQLAILTTGSQGEPMSALVQMSKGEYGRLQIKTGDTLVYSARPIPGNEGAIWRTVNRLINQGCHVIYESTDPIHVSGHAYQEELKMMINLTKPFYVAPVHGEPRHQATYNRIAANMGFPDHRRFTMKAGIPLEISETSAELGAQVPCGRILIDNGGTAGITDEVLRDRYNVANDGFVAITIAVDEAKGTLATDPVLQARGFSGPEDVITRAFGVLYDGLKSMTPDELRDLTKVKHVSADIVKRYIHKMAGVRPLVVSIVLDV